MFTGILKTLPHRLPQHAVSVLLFRRINGALGHGNRRRRFDRSGFHGWLPLAWMGIGTTLSLADRRGECVFSACDHYHKCFSERAIRNRHETPIVIANHAIVMIKAASWWRSCPSYYFDEGHYIFDAADGVFCAGNDGVSRCTIALLADWPLREAGKSRARGLKNGCRIYWRRSSLNEIDGGCVTPCTVSSNLTGWNGFNTIIHKPMQKFFGFVSQQVMACQWPRRALFNRDLFILIEDAIPSAQQLHDNMKALRKPMQRLRRGFDKNYQKKQTLCPRYTQTPWCGCRSLDRRINAMLTLGRVIGKSSWWRWTTAICWLDGNQSSGKNFWYWCSPSPHWLQASHWQIFETHIHSMVITSATYCAMVSVKIDCRQKPWRGKISDETPIRFSIPSPIVMPIRRAFLLSPTSIKPIWINWLRLIENCFSLPRRSPGILPRLRGYGLFIIKFQENYQSPVCQLYAQHVDGIDTGTLVDMFREDTHSCLWGTDAVRDGADVPWPLRMIGLTAPWLRGTILQKARKKVMGGSDFDDRLTWP